MNNRSNINQMIRQCEYENALINKINESGILKKYNADTQIIHDEIIFTLSKDDIEAFNQELTKLIEEVGKTTEGKGYDTRYSED